MAEDFLRKFVVVDLLAARLIIGSFVINFFLIYIPPYYKFNLSLFSNVLDSLAGCLTGLGGETMLLGDFNVTNYYSHVVGEKVDQSAELIINMAAYQALSQFNHLVNHKNRLLDLVFSSMFYDVT